jgi:hypothetical protein
MVAVRGAQDDAQGSQVIWNYPIEVWLAVAVAVLAIVFLGLLFCRR